MSATSASSLSERRSGALSAIDAVLNVSPDSIQPAALALTRAVVTLRDALIEAHRAGRSDVKRQLDHANSLLSLVVSIQYPMQGQDSEKLTKARAELAKLIDEVASD